MEVLNHSSNFDDENIDNNQWKFAVPPCRSPYFSQHRGGCYDSQVSNFSFQPQVEYTGAPGKPKICVTKTSCLIQLFKRWIALSTG